MSTDSLTPEMIQDIVRQWLSDELDRWERYRINSDRAVLPDEHPSNLETLIRLFKQDLKHNKRDEVSEWADKLLEVMGITAEPDTEDYKRLCRELLKARIEWAEIEQRRSEGNYSDGIGTPRSALLKRTPQTQSNVTLSEAAEKYIKTKTDAGDWSKSSLKDIPPQIRDFADIVGNIPVSTLSRDHIRAYHSALLNFPKNRRTKEFAGKSLRELAQLDLPIDKRLAGKTLETRFISVRSFLNWLEAEDHVASAKKLNAVLAVPKDRKPMGQPRTRFTPEDLSKLFDHPGYTQGVIGRGGFNFSYQFWCPLIALHTGARREEVSQLHLNDIRQQDGIWIFDINDTDDKGVKTKAGIRVVPIHPVLIELGILERAKQLKAQGHKLLFPNLKPKNAQGKFGEKVGKWFTRYRRMQGVQTDERTGQGKKFHSFRHTVISELMVNGVDRNKYKHVVGHEGKEDDVTGIYEHGYPVSTLYEDVICKLKFSEIIDFERMKGNEWIRRE